MAVETSIKHDLVARAFAAVYYNCIQSTPESAYNYYAEDSVLSRLGDDGTTMTSVTTEKEISDIIIKSDFKNCKIELQNICSQESVAGGVVVQVVGLMTGKDNVTRNFAQTFFLRQGNSAENYVVVNDIFLYVDVAKPSSPLQINFGTVQLYEDAVIAPTTSPVKEATDNGSPFISSDSLDGKATDNEKPLASSNTHHPSDKKVDVSKPQCNEGENVVVKENNLAIKAQENVPKTSFASVLSKTVAQTPRPTVVVRVGPQHNIQPPSVSDESKRKTKQAAEAAAAAAAASKSLNNSTAEGKATIVHISGLPSKTEVSSIEAAIQTFGPIVPDTLKFIIKKDGWSHASARFQSADSARRACEAGVVRIGNRDCKIQYKKFYNQDGSNGGKSSRRGDLQSENGNQRVGTPLGVPYQNGVGRHN